MHGSKGSLRLWRGLWKARSQGSRLRSRTTSTLRMCGRPPAARLRLRCRAARQRGAEAARCRCEPAGQDQPRPVRLRPQRHPFALRAGPERVRPELRQRRLQFRFRLRGRNRRSRLRARHRYGRLGPRAGRPEQPGRAQAVEGPDQHARRGTGRAKRRLRVHLRPQRSGGCEGAACGHRIRRRGPVLTSPGAVGPAFPAALPFRGPIGARMVRRPLSPKQRSRRRCALCARSVARLSPSTTPRCAAGRGASLRERAGSRTLRRHPAVLRRTRKRGDRAGAQHHRQRPRLQRGRPGASADPAACAVPAGGADVGRHRCAAGADGADALHDRRDGGRSRRPQPQPRRLYQLRQPAGLSGALRAQRPARRRAAFRRHADRSLRAATGSSPNSGSAFTSATGLTQGATGVPLPPPGASKALLESLPPLRRRPCASLSSAHTCRECL